MFGKLIRQFDREREEKDGDTRGEPSKYDIWQFYILSLNKFQNNNIWDCMGMSIEY